MYQKGLNPPRGRENSTLQRHTHTKKYPKKFSRGSYIICQKVCLILGVSDVTWKPSTIAAAKMLFFLSVVLLLCLQRNSGMEAS